MKLSIPIRLGAMALAVAGILFVLYPAIRPFSSETGLEGATAFGSNAWLVAHMLAMIAFTLLALGLVGLYVSLRDTAVEMLSFWTLVAGVLGVGGTLPFYGGEAFGLHAIGIEALRQHSGSLVSLSETVRGQPQLTLFLIGLLLIGVSAVMAAIAVWKSGVLQKWSAVLFAVAFALYIPQFFGSQPIRIAHGLLVTVGCLWLAVSLGGAAGQPPGSAGGLKDRSRSSRAPLPSPGSRIRLSRR
jgi:hypothetical protein